MLPSLVLEEHSNLCVQITKWEIELDQCSETLSKLRDTLTEESKLLVSKKSIEKNREDLRMLQETDQLITVYVSQQPALSHPHYSRVA